MFQAMIADNQLYDRRYLAGDEYTIADMAAYPWTIGWQNQGQDINEFEYFKRWFDEVGNRAAAKRGMEVGSDLSVDTSKLPSEEQERIRKFSITNVPERSQSRAAVPSPDMQ